MKWAGLPSRPSPKKTVRWVPHHAPRRTVTLRELVSRVVSRVDSDEQLAYVSHVPPDLNIGEFIGQKGSANSGLMLRYFSPTPTIPPVTSAKVQSCIEPATSEGTLC